MQLEAEVDYEVIQEIRSIKKKRANKDFLAPALLVAKDCFAVLPSGMSDRAVDEAWNKKDFLERINFADVTDIVFPSFKKISQKIKEKDKGIPFKIITSAEEYWVWLSERSFWLTRKLFEDTLYIKENVG